MYFCQYYVIFGVKLLLLPKDRMQTFMFTF